MNTSTTHSPDDYDWDDYESDATLQYWFIAFGLIGVIDNAFVLLVIGAVKSLRNPTNLLIANQSLIDLATSGLLLALTIAPRNLYPDRPEALSRFVCIFWMSWYPFWATIDASSISLLMISIERFLAVVYPIKYRQKMTTRRTIIFAAIPWFYGFCFNTYVLILSDIHEDYCAILVFPSQNFQKIFSIAMIGVHFIGLITAISVLYIIIAIHLRRGNVTGKSKAVDFKERARSNIIRTMFIVFACYFLCWAPNDILILNHVITGNGQLEGQFFNATMLIAFGNAWINPIIYSFRYKKFQSALKGIFCRKAHRDENGSCASISNPSSERSFRCKNRQASVSI